jgi:hypothetical protein
MILTSALLRACRITAKISSMNYFVLAIVLLLVILGAQYYYTDLRVSNGVKIESASSTITFPQGGEELEAGEVYTLSWTNGPDPIHIFLLIDRSLKTEGA